MVNDMIYKEEHILFPMALETLSEEDWAKGERGRGGDRVRLGPARERVEGIGGSHPSRRFWRTRSGA